MSQKLMDYFPTDMEFLVELKFKNPNEETANKLLSSLVGNNELLPDLQVQAIHCRASSTGQVGSKMLLDGVTEAYEEFKLKVNNLINKDWNDRLQTECEVAECGKISHHPKIC